MTEVFEGNVRSFEEITTISDEKFEWFLLI
jgi:hypothetical protein